MFWNTPPPWGYNPYQCPMPQQKDDEDVVSYLRRTRRQLKELEEELKSEKKADFKEQRGRRLSTTEVFLFLTLASPIVGPLYMYAVIAGANHISEMLKQVVH
jgi:hypothetical protein